MPLDAAGPARARFQSGLLAWLRAPADPTGLREMVAVLRELAAADDDASRQMLWRSAEAFLASILAGRQPVGEDERTLCRRIERHLAAVAKGDTVDDTPLRDALFAFISRKPAPTAALPAPAPLPGNGLLGAALGKTAELLPLIAGAVTPRFAAELVNAWTARATALDEAWHRLHASEAGEACRSAATELVAAALAMNDTACLRLAEALATACALGEQRTAREQPALRAAIIAGLEIACERDAPNHPHFARRVEHVAERLDQAQSLAGATMRTNRERSDFNWYVDEAFEVIGEMRHALHAVPPDAVAIRQGADWFATTDGAGKAVAIVGLANLIGKVVLNNPPDRLDTAPCQQALQQAFAALERACEEMLVGHPPKPDEAAFAALRALTDGGAPLQSPPRVD